MTKRGSSFDMRVVILRGRVSIGHFVRGSVDMRDIVRILCIFSFLSFIDALFLYFRSCEHFYLHTLYLSSLYMLMYVSFTYPLHVLFFFLSLCTCFLLLVCNLLFLFHTKMP